MYIIPLPLTIAKNSLLALTIVSGGMATKSAIDEFKTASENKPKIEYCSTTSDTESNSTKTISYGTAMILAGLGYSGVKIKEKKTIFKNKFGSFNLTKLGLSQYEHITDKIRNYEKLQVTTTDKNKLKSYNQAIEICLSKLNLLSQLGEINLNSSKNLHSFKDKYGEYNLTNKGLEQYITSIISIAGYNNLSKENFGTSDYTWLIQYIQAGKQGLSKLNLLSQLGEINTNSPNNLHEFKDKYGKYELSNKGLSQYLEIMNITTTMDAIKDYYNGSIPDKNEKAFMIDAIAKNELRALTKLKEINLDILPHSKSENYNKYKKYKREKLDYSLMSDETIREKMEYLLLRQTGVFYDEMPPQEYFDMEAEMRRRYSHCAP